MHYRGLYTQIKRQLKQENPQGTNDIAIYLVAMKDGDAMDGYRVIMQSNAMRELKGDKKRQQQYMKTVGDLIGPYREVLSAKGNTQGFTKMLNRAKQPQQVIRADRGRSRDLGRGR